MMTSRMIRNAPRCCETGNFTGAAPCEVDAGFAGTQFLDAQPFAPADALRPAASDTHVAELKRCACARPLG